MDARGIILERHRYGDSAIAPVTYLQDRMQALSVSKDILGKEDIQASMIGSAYEGRSTFLPGDFVVLRTRPSAALVPDGRAWSWGRVSATRTNVSRNPSGSLTHAPYTVLMQGWYDMLSRTKLHVFEQRGLPSVGTAFNITDWMAIGATLNSSFGDDAGVILQYMIKQVVRIRLPESLGGGWLSDEIPVVHNEDTARQYAREFMGIESVSFGRLMPSMVQRFGEQRSTDVGSLINGMFVPEPMLIEVFPYLSMGGETQQTTPGTSASGTGTTTAQPPPNSSQTPPPQVAQPASAAPLTKLGQILGRQPVIVYRIKPFRLNPLYTAAVAKPVYLDEHVEEGYLFDQQQALQTGTAHYSQEMRNKLETRRRETREKTAKMITKPLLSDALFAQQTFSSAGCVPLDWSHVTQLSRQRADSERINASTIHVAPPADAVATSVNGLDGLGLPITLDKQVEEYGLRIKISKWPFYTPVGTTAELSIFYRAVAAQIMQFYQNAHLFEYGHVTTHFTKAAKITESLSTPSTADELMPDLEPGRWFRTSYVNSAGGNEYFGYITSLNHSIQRTSAGNLSAHTVLNFMRGHFAEEWDALHGVVVPITEQDTPVTLSGPPGTSTGSSSRGSLPMRDSTKYDTNCNAYKSQQALLDQYSVGIDATDSNPAAFAAAATAAQRPLFLKCWLLEALALNDATAKRIDNVLAGIGIGSAYSANLWALAACCYVIERYWRLVHPKARLRIRSIPRTNDGFHDLFAAADFYVETNDPKVLPPTALQLWGSLFKLIDAGRIPEGGQGLYLNVNPTTGIQGVLPHQAGKSSGSGPGLPAGGSSWPHYDIAGSFGGISRPGRSGPFSWLSVDWIGKGSDQLTRISKSYEAYVAEINKTKDPKKKQQRLDNLENGGTPSDLDDVLAGIADPGLIRLGRLSNAKPIPTRVAELLSLRVARIQSGINDEDTRVPLRDAIGDYFNKRGRSDTSLHAVNNKVPNAIQVLNGLNWPVQVGVTLATPPTTSTTASAPAPLRHGKFTPAPTTGAPFIAVYGGSDVAGTPSGVYMYTYVTPKLTAKNNVYVAANYRVPGVQSHDEGAARVQGTPSKRILYMFSGGELPCRKVYEKYGATFDRVYLVDAFLAQSTQVWANFISKDPTKFVFVYTPIPQNGPVGRGTPSNQPINRENGMTQAQLNIILSYAAQGMQVVQVPLLTPTPTDQQLLERHMFTNEKAVEHMVNSRIIIT